MTRRFRKLIYQDRGIVPKVGTAHDVTSFRAVLLRRSLKENQEGGT